MPEYFQENYMVEVLQNNLVRTTAAVNIPIFVDIKSFKFPLTAGSRPPLFLCLFI
jgi:hypothetical protein